MFSRSCVVAPLDQAYVYGGKPPVTVTSIFPVALPKQSTSDVPSIVAIKVSNVTDVVPGKLSHPVEISLTANSYVPAPKLLKSGESW